MTIHFYGRIVEVLLMIGNFFSRLRESAFVMESLSLNYADYICEMEAIILLR